MNHLMKSIEQLTNSTCSIDIHELNKCGLVGIVPHEYQLLGINWLGNCDSQNHGGLLCDEMGLGKTCQLCVIDEAFFRQIDWNYVIVDEGHRLKNSSTQLYSVLTETCLGIRFILTGTPVQNNLEELFNLLHFVAPNYFCQQLRPTFVNYFANSDESSKKHETEKDMAKILRPFLLRRIKQNVLTDLPPRIDVMIYHSLTRLQTHIYRALLTRNADLFTFTVDSQNNSRTYNRLGNLIIQLKKCVNHPYLFDGVEPEPFNLGEHLVEASSKLVLLDLLLAFLYDPHNSSTKMLNNSSNFRLKPVHKVLIFCQMTRMLDIIQDYLTLRGYSYERLDGSIRGEDRFQATENFNRDQETFIFLLSTRAGGQGLNLTAADTVIFVDNDFNPQMDVQAAGRAHRIGQTKPVRVIRLVGKNTVEEVILSRAENKLKLAAQVLSATDAKSNKDNKPFTFDELNNMLKFGLAKLLKSADDDCAQDDNDTEAKQDNGKPNFTLILGGSDLKTGHWLPPSPCDFNNYQDDQNTKSSYGWLLLTSEPYHCEPSTADQEAIAKLQQEYELSKAKLKIKGQFTGETEDDDNKVRIEEYNLRSQISTSVFRKLKSHCQKLTSEEIEARSQKIAEDLERVQARLAGKLPSWQSVDYNTFSVFRVESIRAQLDLYLIHNRRSSNVDIAGANSEKVDNAINELDEEIDRENQTTARIYYKIGDASSPLSCFSINRSENSIDGIPPYFVCFTVDDSGSWGRGGIFRSLDARSSQIKSVYELAGQMDDIELGDCLLIPVENPDNLLLAEKKIQTFGEYLVNYSGKINSNNVEWSTNFCGLLVAQKRTNCNRSIGKPPSLQLNALERSLYALGMACARLKLCSVHIPRLGHGDRALTWYSIERLLRKHLVDHYGISVYVYPLCNLFSS
ncbi:unnamed protein product [Heterobilharzia americana]|nr:unnamed protein product [Heterobilharzia americana]